MQREIVRTIQSFLPPYQLGLEDKNIEIIVIDNGSDVLPDLQQFGDKIKFVQYDSEYPSPVKAINHGIKIASSDLVGVLIDGARLVTPGICRDVINVNAQHDRVFISTLAYHLGPDVQMNSVYKGYNQEVEDKLLEKIDWLNNGYDLFLTSCLAKSSSNGLNGPISESNAIFMGKHLWEELDRFEEQFISIGGGLSNLDVYKRAGELKDVKLVRLISEATFHQVHGGVATNVKMGTHSKVFSEEYKSIRGVPFVSCDKTPGLYGNMLLQVEYFFSEQKERPQFSRLHLVQSELNEILYNYTDGLLFNS